MVVCRFELYMKAGNGCRLGRDVCWIGRVRLDRLGWVWVREGLLNNVYKIIQYFKIQCSSKYIMPKFTVNTIITVMPD
jgi:hypothetical protein